MYNGIELTMKQFLSFLKKEFTHIFRDKLTMLILLVMPILLITLFGYVITTEVRNSRVVIVDQTNNELSHSIIQRVDANSYFSVVKVTEDPQEEPQAMLRGGKADVVLIINRNQGVQILTDGSEPNLAQSRTAYIQNILMQTMQDQMSSVSAISQGNAAVSHGNDAVSQGGGAAQASASMMAGINITSRMLFNPQLKSEYNFVPGIVGMIVMLICAMMTSISIVREKEMGTMEILLASPLPPLTIILAKLVPYFTVSSFNVITILLVSRYLMGVPIAGSLVAYLVIFCLYVLVALALGLLISCAVSTQLVAMLLSLLLLVPTMYFSGLAFNIESMPVPFQVVSNIVPAKWFIDAARRLLIQGVEVRYVMKDALILVVMAVVLIFISLKLFKTRLE